MARGSCARRSRCPPPDPANRRRLARPGDPHRADPDRADLHRADLHRADLHRADLATRPASW
ncbi:pentapeptide repeat-containing protein [Nonomuraea sp. NPDC001023]|uniref:pentapeptide repeat-containing protein n=1 Tax=unclassified Nonomuraea TaxID=2593643 RepID=UPI003324C730